MNNTLFVFSAAFGQIFWDENNTIITAIHENDGNFRKEYMEDLFTHFGITVKMVKERPKWLTDEILIEYGVDE
jgi:hypothetical protein